MKENRLFKIVYFILEKGRVTAPELAEKFEVSVRTIYRDVDVISSAGIPIYVTTGRYGGIQILEHYTLDKVIFSEKEKQLILTALQSLSLVDNTFEKEILTKISALFNMHSENWIEVDFSYWGSNEQNNTKFDLLKEATITHKVVNIVYASSYCETTRKIHPLKLFYKAKEWYVKAYCTQRKDFRLFKMNRIIDCEILEEDFIPVAFPELQDMNTSNKIILRFPKRIAYRIYDEFRKDEFIVQENGDFLVTTYMPIDNWLIGYLLTFGTDVDVIDPMYLRDAVSEEARKIYEKNKP